MAIGERQIFAVHTNKMEGICRFKSFDELIGDGWTVLFYPM